MSREAVAKEKPNRRGIMSGAKRRREVDSNRRRVQLEFTQTAFEELQELKERSGCATNADVVRRALRTYDYIVRAQEDGGKVFVERDNQRHEVVLL